MAFTTSPFITLSFTTGGGDTLGYSFTVAPNSGAARTGTLTVAGQTITVNQAGAF